MAGEVALSPSQVKKNGRWRPIKHNTTLSLRSYSPISIPRRRSSLNASMGRRPLPPIQEYKATSVKNHSTGSLDSILPTYQPTSWKSSSEQLVFIQASPQLQQLQSVSSDCSEELRGWDSARRLYRTQSQWAKLPPALYVPSGIAVFQSSPILELQDPPTSEATSPTETTTTTDLNGRYSAELETDFIVVGEDLPREDIAELFQRVEEYDREHPEVVRESGRVWVRVNSVGHGLSKTLKRMGSLHKKKPTFEARLGPNIPVYSRLRCYEKPSRVERIKIAVHDCWRKFRNWSTGRDTELQARRLGSTTAHLTIRGSVISFNLAGMGNSNPQMGQGRLSGVLKLEGGVDAMAYLGHTRKDSKYSTYDEPLKRRRSSLFLDIYSTDSSVTS